MHAMGIERFVTNSVKSCLNTAVFVLSGNRTARNYQVYKDCRPDKALGITYTDRR